MTPVSRPYDEATARVADPPVWAPIDGFPAAYVPLARQGLRFWDKDGPQQ